MSQKKLIYIVFLILLSFFSCKKESSIIEQKNDENYIDVKQANSIATSFVENQSSYTKKSQGKGTSEANPIIKAIKSSVAMKGEDELNVFYVINYEGGGFSIVSADKRTPKILAFSDKGFFRTDTIMPGIDGWVASAKSIIKDIRAKNVKYTGQDKFEIYPKNKGSKGNSVKNPPIDTGCTDEFEEVEPLIQTVWRQDAGYNQLMPSLVCGPNGHTYVGCVATAMAQIIRYHEYPASWFNYSIMPNNIGTSYYSSGAYEIASLMAFIDATIPQDPLAGLPYIDPDKYQCSGTFTESENAVNSFINYFGYSSSVTQVNYSGSGSNAVINNLRAGNPVLFSGGRQNWIGAYVDGHAWVCDGFYRGFYCMNGGYTGATEIIYLHHNWGYGEDNGNAFYLDLNFYALGRTFNYQTKAIVNIVP